MAVEKGGKGVTNPELYQYLDKEGKNLSPDLFELIDYNSWNEKIQNGWRNGYNYVTGETYNPALGSIIATSQYIQDGVTWLNETNIGLAVQTLGFTYASYRMMTKNGPAMVENEQVSGSGNMNLPKATELTMTETVSNHATDIIKKGVNAGELSRPYVDSKGTYLLIQEIMDSGIPVKDASLPNGLRWEVSGSFNGRGQGIWELVVDLDTNKIVHFNFTK